MRSRPASELVHDLKTAGHQERVQLVDFVARVPPPAFHAFLVFDVAFKVAALRGYEEYTLRSQNSSCFLQGKVAITFGQYDSCRERVLVSPRWAVCQEAAFC